MFRLALALIILLASPAQAADQSTCGKVEGPRPYGYCITVTPGSKTKDVLYVLHGAGGDGKGDWWVTDPALDGIKENFKKAGYQPRVIEVSFGAVWLLVPQTKNPRSGLLEIFTDHVMPELEGKLEGKVAKRKILGHSMGGLNGAILALTRPDLFKAAALMAPAFLGVSPFAGPEAQAQYEQSRGMPAGYAKNVLSIARAYVNSEEEWKEISPTIIAPDLAGFGRADFLVSAGPEDILFFEEARIFAEQVKKNDAFTVWDKHEHGHGFVSSSAIASFLSLPF